MVDLMVTYLEMSSPPQGLAVAVPVGASMGREWLARDDYLALYRAVGGPWQWDERLRLPGTEIDRLLADPSCHVHVLRFHSDAVGFCEFQGVGGAEVELVHFGLVPEVHGRGLGAFLLDHALRDCWSFSPRRIWLHTDTNDHPRARSIYEKAGFLPYLQRMERFPD